MENFVITIARQYGSGGRTVGKMLAEKLGVSFYDKQIIQMASDESGIDVKLFGQVEEGSSKGLWYTACHNQGRGICGNEQNTFE